MIKFMFHLRNAIINGVCNCNAVVNFYSINEAVSRECPPCHQAAFQSAKRVYIKIPKLSNQNLN